MKTFPKKIKVNPSDYEVMQFANGYFAICEKDGHGAGIVHGGDSAFEDDYNEEYMNDVYEEWDGTLYYDSNYGYRITE